ncbi:MAG: hypothetical protein GY941_11860 [Planctomycetes bacterium]|nr:hypothetical protein [Planctomycetota bacterium]
MTCIDNETTATNSERHPRRPQPPRGIRGTVAYPPLYIPAMADLETLTQTDVAEVTEYEDLDIEDVEKRAKDFNCSVYSAKEDELLLDIDNENDYRRLGDRITSLKDRDIIVHIRDQWRSKSNKWHVVMHLKDHILRSLPEKLLLQVCLGSDPKHVSVAYQRWLMGQEVYNLLFKPIRTTEGGNLRTAEQPVPF